MGFWLLVSGVRMGGGNATTATVSGEVAFGGLRVTIASDSVRNTIAAAAPRN